MPCEKKNLTNHTLSSPYMGVPLPTLEEGFSEASLHVREATVELDTLAQSLAL